MAESDYVMLKPRPKLLQEKTWLISYNSDNITTIGPFRVPVSSNKQTTVHSLIAKNSENSVIYMSSATRQEAPTTHIVMAKLSVVLES